MVALSVQAHHDSMAVFQYMYCHYDSYRYRHLAVLVYPANRDYLVDLHQLFLVDVTVDVVTFSVFFLSDLLSDILSVVDELSLRLSSFLSFSNLI